MSQFSKLKVYVSKDAVSVRVFMYMCVTGAHSNL